MGGVRGGGVGRVGQMLNATSLRPPGDLGHGNIVGRFEHEDPIQNFGINSYTDTGEPLALRGRTSAQFCFRGLGLLSRAETILQV